MPETPMLPALRALRRPVPSFVLGVVGALGVSATAFSIAFVATGPNGPSGLDGRAAAHVLAWTMALAAGYQVAFHLVLATPDAAAAVSSRRSAVAGALATCVLFIALMLIGRMPDLARVAVAALSGASVGTYLLWPHRAGGRRPARARATERA
jgi:hypothetical protein